MTGLGEHATQGSLDRRARPRTLGRAMAAAAGTTGTSSRQPGASSGAESVMERYRKQEARLTRRLRWTAVIIAAGTTVVIYAISVGDTAHTTAAIAGMLMCLAAAGQTRTARNRVRQLLESGTAEKIAHRIAEAGARPQPTDAPLFSQQYCRVNRQFAGGRLQAGPVPPMFLVAIRDAQLTVVQAPATPVMRVPIVYAQIATPKLQRRVGGITTLRIGDQLWGFDFTGVYLAERGIGVLRQVFSLGSPRKSFRRGREINDRFVAALGESGANAMPV